MGSFKVFLLFLFIWEAEILRVIIHKLEAAAEMPNMKAIDMKQYMPNDK